MKYRLKIISTSLSLILASVCYADENKVPYPEGYRSWGHVKSMVIEPGHQLANPFQGIHHIYANDKALKGLKGGSYTDGSVLVFDLLNYNEKDKAMHEGGRKLVGVMHRDTQKYSKTGGWGFEGFSADSKTKRLSNDGGVSCFGCHIPQKDKGYVYSTYRN